MCTAEFRLILQFKLKLQSDVTPQNILYIYLAVIIAKFTAVHPQMPAQLGGTGKHVSLRCTWRLGWRGTAWRSGCSVRSDVHTPCWSCAASPLLKLRNPAECTASVPHMSAAVSPSVQRWSAVSPRSCAAWWWRVWGDRRERVPALCAPGRS